MLSNLKKYFKKRNCYLMPHPGTNITKKEFDGDLNLLDLDFINYCNAFYENTLESIKLDSSDHRNDVFKSGENLINMFSEYVKAFECNSFPNLESMTNVSYRNFDYLFLYIQLTVICSHRFIVNTII